MTEHGWIELVALVVGGLCAVMVLLVGRQKGIGPQIRMALALCLITPVLLILGLYSLLSPLLSPAIHEYIYHILH